MQYLKTLLKLKQERELNYSQIPKKLLEDLQNEGLVVIKGIKNRKKVVANDFFDEAYPDLEVVANAQNRSDLAQTGDTKAKNIAVMDGFYINGVCKLENITLPIVDESVLFIKKLPKIDTTTLIVIVENFENIVYAQKLLRYFKNEDILFIYRNKKALEFVETTKNEVIYFGDFDLAGVNIYLNEILKRNKDVELFIPKNIKELLIKYGSPKLYKKQFFKYKDIKSDIKEIEQLLKMMHELQKSLEQEWFLIDDIIS